MKGQKMYIPPVVAVRQSIPDATSSEVQEAFDGIDVTSLHNMVLSEFTHSLWDHTSPINGTSAAVFHERDDVSEGDIVVLIDRGGSTVLFQPHQPAGGPFADVEEAQAFAQDFIEKTVETEVYPSITQQIVTHIIDARAAGANAVQAQLDELADFIATNL